MTEGGGRLNFTLKLRDVIYGRPSKSTRLMRDDAVDTHITKYIGHQNAGGRFV